MLGNAELWRRFRPSQRTGSAGPRRRTLGVEKLDDRIVPAGDLTTVVNWYAGLQFRTTSGAPLRVASTAPALGAIAKRHDQDFLDNDDNPNNGVSTTTGYVVDPYFAALSATEDVRSGNAGSLARAKLFIEWWMRELPANGIMPRYQYLPTGTAFFNSSLPPDSVDATGPVFFRLLEAYAKAGGDTAPLTATGAKGKLESMAAATLALQDSTDGLTRVSATNSTKYLADNSEVYAGLRSLAYLEETLYLDPTRADTYRAAADRVKEGILEHLYGWDGASDAGDGDYFYLAKKPAVGSYDDTFGRNLAATPNPIIGLSPLQREALRQWPMMMGVIDPTDAKAVAQYDRLNELFDNPQPPNWDEDFFDEVVGSSPTVYWPRAELGVAAFFRGDTTRQASQAAALLAAYFPNANSHAAAPFINADAGWLFRNLAGPTLDLALTDYTFAENGGVGATMLTVTRQGGDVSAALTVTLASSSGDASLPLTVQIPAGQRSAVIDVTAIDNTDPDGIRIGVFTATAAGHRDGKTGFVVVDDDTLSISLNPALVPESAGPGAVAGTVTRAGSTALPLTVTLSSSDVTELTVPQTVTIPANQTQVSFVANPIDDPNADGDVTVVVTASAAGLVDATAVVEIQDDEPTTTGIPAQTIAENTASTFINLRNRFDDIIDGPDGLVYTVTYTSDPSGVVAAASVNATSDVLVVTYAPNKIGSATLFIRATNSRGSFVETPLDITVKPAFVDDFNRPDSTTLGTGLVEGFGDAVIRANRLVGNSSVSRVDLSMAAAADLTASARVSVPALTGAVAGFVVRNSAAGGYQATISRAGSAYVARVFRFAGSSQVTLATRTLAGFSGTADVTFAAVGSSLALYVGGKLQLAAADATHTTGGVSLVASLNSAFDNLSIRTLRKTGTVGGAGSANPRSVYTFDSGTTLGAEWTSRVGAFSVTGGKAQANAAVNLANLLNVTLRDAALSADVVVPTAANASVGLVARYGGPGDTNYYLGSIYRVNGVLIAGIFRQQGTTRTLLASSVLSGFNGTGNLRFEVSGTKLRLYVNNTLRATAFDGAFAASGFGLRSTAGGRYDNAALDLVTSV